jgi:hypothetical protein
MNDRKKGFLILLPLVAFIFQALCFIAACNPKYQDATPGDSFRKIYDKSDTSHYVGLDIAQTADGGYIILGKVDRAPYLLRVDEQGRFLWDTAFTMSENYRDPAPGILIRESANPGGTEYYFFCLSLPEDVVAGWVITKLLKFYEKDNRLVNPKPEATILCDKNGRLLIKPISAAKIGDDRFLLLAQDKESKDGSGMMSVKINTLGVVLDAEKHAPFYMCDYPPEDKRYHIAASLANQSKCFFQTYKRESVEGANCFMTAMMEASGYADDYIAEFPLIDPFIAMEWHGEEGENSTLSGARVEEGLVHYMVNIPIREADNDNYKKEGETLNELDESLPVYIQTAMSGGEEIVFFLGTARSGDIEIYAYKLADRKFWGYMEINGGRERYVAAGLIETRDGGLAVLGNTNIESRMGRICLFKLSKEEVAAMAGQ